MYEEDLTKVKAIDRKTNWFDKKQFNAIHILKNVIGPI